MDLAFAQRVTKGDPWLSTGLVKIGNPIYLAKWETNEAAPRLLHIQSIADVELFGINATNYGTFVLEQAEWQRRYGFNPGGLQRGELPAAIARPAVSPPQVPPPPSVRPPATTGEVFRVNVSRMGSNAYRDQGSRVWIITRGCIELALGTNALLDMTTRELIFPNSTCSVRVVSRPNAELTRVGQDRYQDTNTQAMLRTRFCYEYVYYEEALVLDDEVIFRSGGRCDLAF